ncbi:uncharacterized protein V1516DRAFT_554631 [Lipomyces oligophaga]|uniref:uncharacterized protein n=1 Tax=Lipomyces oligophaga TaxID=45792 RepID=UPI0034CFCB78
MISSSPSPQSPAPLSPPWSSPHSSFVSHPHRRPRLSPVRTHDPVSIITRSHPRPRPHHRPAKFRKICSRDLSSLHSSPRLCCTGTSYSSSRSPYCAGQQLPSDIFVEPTLSSATSSSAASSSHVHSNNNHNSNNNSNSNSNSNSNTPSVSAQSLLQQDNFAQRPERRSPSLTAPAPVTSNRPQVVPSSSSSRSVTAIANLIDSPSPSPRPSSSQSSPPTARIPLKNSSSSSPSLAHHSLPPPPPPAPPRHHLVSSQSALPLLPHTPQFEQQTRSSPSLILPPATTSISGPASISSPPSAPQTTIIPTHGSFPTTNRPIPMAVRRRGLRLEDFVLNIIQQPLRCKAAAGSSERGSYLFYV